MNRVFVLSHTKAPLMPCHPAHARQLLSAGRAAVYRTVPFTLILKDRTEGETQAVELKVDPGSKTTGVALVGGFEQQGATVLFGAHLNHRGAVIKNRLESRRTLRRGRRGRKTRYRAARFLNRTRPAGWLPPSVDSRVQNLESLAAKLAARCPITRAAVEIVKFDTQALQNPEISGVEYQQGELAGYEVREYLLEKWQRTCAYCGAQHVPLQVEHIQLRARGGSNRVSNLTLACRPCNERKGARPAEEFLKGRPEVLRRLQAHAKAPLKDAAAVNAARWILANRLQARWPVAFGSGGRTKWNRTRQGYPKAHWVDAACVGESGATVTLSAETTPLTITAKGRGVRQVVRTDKYGFPRGKAGRIKRVHGFSTGDRVRLVQTSGKYAGTYVGRLAGIRATGILDLKAGSGTISASWKHFTLIQRGDGYEYA
jgi:5-methylcytosine-specific restriction endonuclease McrA